MHLHPFEVAFCNEAFAKSVFYMEMVGVKAEVVIG